MKEIKKDNPTTRRKQERLGKIYGQRGGSIRDFKSRSVNVEEVNMQSEGQDLGFTGQFAIEDNPFNQGTPSPGATNAAVVFTDLDPTPKFGWRSSIIPVTDNFYNNGDASFAWARVYSHSFPAPSDARIKNSIVPIEYGLHTLKKLKPVSFKYNGKEEKRLGFLAQEVKEVVPEVVQGSEETRYSMSYDELIPILVKAVQELSSRVKELEDNVV